MWCFRQNAKEVSMIFKKITGGNITIKNIQGLKLKLFQETFG